MTVYIEYALLENFILDGLLLYLAVRIAHGEVIPLRLLLAAIVGAGEALLFPVLALPLWCSYLVKILGGVVLASIAVKGVKRSVFVSIAFFLLTFALGGLLTAAYSFFGVSYEEGNGFLVERAPVALVFGAAGVFAVLVGETARRFFRFGKEERSITPCTLEHGGRTVRWRGLADSGNLLEFRGRGVCVCSAAAIFALFGRGAREVGRIRVETVNGEKESPVFECTLRTGKNGDPQPVYLTVGQVKSPRYQLILHTSYV